MKIQDFIPAAQLRLIRQLQKGEEKEFFLEKEKEIQGIIDSMPKPYEQDGLNDKAIVHLHYFGGCYDASWWITERDVDGPGGQIQAFGYASFGGKSEAECGYICIKDLLKQPGIELDLYWTPKTVKETLGD